MQKFITATLTGGISMWLLAGLWHEVIMAQFYAAETQATHEGTFIILVAYLVLGALMAYMYPLGYKGGRPVVEGLRFGMLIGVIWVFPHELAMAGAHGDPLVYVFKNAAWDMAGQGLGGFIVALVYSRGNSANGQGCGLCAVAGN